LLEIKLIIVKHLTFFSITLLLLSNCSTGNLLTIESTQKNEEPLEFNINPDNTAAEKQSIFDLFSDDDDSETTLKVNRYIWKAALEVLDFLPIESADPFSGIFTTGWGSPPGTNLLYKATVYVQDPSLDARSLKVTLLKKTGPVNSETVRVVEDAILSKARLLRISDDKL